MSVFKMPPRLPEDGPVGVRRLDDERLGISVESPDGQDRTEIHVSPYNAARIFGMLALFGGSCSGFTWACSLAIFGGCSPIALR